MPPDRSSILYCSPAYEELWGRSVEELYANPRAWLDGIHPDDQERVTAACERAPYGYDAEYRVLRPDGSVAHVHDRAHPVLDAAGNVERIVGIATDITTVKRLEEQLLHAQKMESLGRLAGGVAHEVNNLLTIVLGHAALARDQPDDAAQHLAVIEQTARRGGALTARLLGFTRSQPIRAGALDVAQLAREREPELRELLGPDVRLECELDPAAWPVRADPLQVGRLLLALAQNGVDAMPDGGRLTIAIGNLTTADDDHGLAPGDHVVLTVTDTGSGIGAEDRSRVFEPFFSTRPDRAGMGLTDCYGIVARAGGQIRLESAPGRGTTVVCTFPRATARAPAAPSTRPEGDRSETVLVAEDDPMVREIVSGVLRGLGFDVVEAEDGVAALHATGKAPPIALLVTDVAMPRMGGRELADALRALNPGLRVLFVSGYSDEALGDAGDPGIAFVAKPFMADELVSAVRGLLEAEHA
jgi:PAS domain S-box-containing protein